MFVETFGCNLLQLMHKWELPTYKYMIHRWSLSPHRLKMLLYLKYKYKYFYKQLFCSSLKVVLSKCAHCAVNRCITFYILIMWDLFIGMEVVGGRFYISVLVLFTSFYRWYSMLLLLVAVYILSLQFCLHTSYIWSGIRMSQFSDWTPPTAV